MRKLTRAGLAGVATAALLAPGLAANAEEEVFLDPAGDSGSATDIKEVDVNFGDHRLRVVVRFPGSDLTGSYLRYWLDTKRKNHGPEYVATVIPNSDGLGLAKVKGWKRPNHGRPVDCDGLRAFADSFDGPTRTWVKIPNSCFGDPNKVRVAAQTKHGADSDWAKARRTFLPAVSQG